MDQGLLAIPAANVTVLMRVASPATQVEEITPLKKKARVDKGKEKASSRLSSVWDNVDLVQTRSQEVFSSDKLKALSGVPPNEMVGHHVHKLVQVICSTSLSIICLFIIIIIIIITVESPFQVLGETIHITSEYLSQKARVLSVKAKAKGLQVELSKLKKDLIATMDEANTAKEKAKVLSDDLKAKRQLTLEKDEQLQATKERVKTVTAKSVEAFKQTEEYKTVLCSWYYKGFELLRRFLVKHIIGIALEELDLEAMDKEMVIDKAAQASQAI